MKKILMVAESYYPNIGGVEKHLYKINEKLIGKGYEIFVLTKSDKNLEENISGVKVFSLKLSGNMINKYKVIGNWLGKNRNLIKELDIIHFHDFKCFYWFLPFLPSLKAVPYVTFHGWEGNIPPKKAHIIMRKITEKLCKGNICVGGFIEKWYGTKADILIYGGCEMDKEKGGFEKNKDAIFFGRLEKDTYIIEYIEMIKTLNSKYSLNLSLDIFGKGTMKDRVIELIKGEKNIRLYEPISNIEEKIESYKYAFINSYLAIIEALYKECIVFSYYDNELKKDYLEGIAKEMPINMLSGDNPEQGFLNGIDNDEEGKRYEIRKLIHNNYNWEKVSEKYIQLWNR